MAYALERSGEGLVRTAAQQNSSAGQPISNAGRSTWPPTTKIAYDRRSQDLRMWFAGVGLALGVFLTLLLPRFLPFAVDTHVASLVMEYERSYAGRLMIGAAVPKGWRNMVKASQLLREKNKDTKKCNETASAANKDQDCTITVKMRHHSRK